MKHNYRNMQGSPVRKKRMKNDKEDEMNILILGSHHVAKFFH